MNIIFSLPNSNDVELIYETYRMDEEPDSPSISFSEISDEEKARIIQQYQIYFQVVTCNGDKVGWVTVINRATDLEINLGFGLFEDYRGRGLMASIIREATKNILSLDGEKKLTSSTRVGNFAAIKSLERAGFLLVGNVERPPVGKWTKPIVYSRFEFNRD